jgi:hypothetical protein
METFNSKSFSGRVYETKDSVVIESVISEKTETSMKSVRLEDVSDFINAKLKEFIGKEVNVEVSIKITEKRTTDK